MIVVAILMLLFKHGSQLNASILHHSKSFLKLPSRGVFLRWGKACPSFVSSPNSELFSVLSLPLCVSPKPNYFNITITMPENAEAHAAHLTTNRNCTVEITNVSAKYCLVNPKVFMESGFSYSPPQPTVRTQQTEVFSFTKDDNTASGAVGVFTYELFDMHARKASELMAVMFSVPFDYNFYKNWLAVGVFEQSRACDEKLYKSMYNDKDFTNFTRCECNGSGIMFSSSSVDVRACMGDQGRAILKIELYDKMY
ncbi:hypothetical protein WMY93_010740 [Mugilogobius chulae]|uniref:Uncharacterized protein n=1 Tax=Mugilogobius chulae TaxID=88201 RepID=A0AAW0PDW5_9GOBI